MPSLEVCTSTFVCCSASYEDVGPHMTDIANLFSKRSLTENLFVKFPICFIYTINFYCNNVVIGMNNR